MKMTSKGKQNKKCTQPQIGWWPQKWGWSKKLAGSENEDNLKNEDDLEYRWPQNEDNFEMKTTPKGNTSSKWRRPKN